MFGTAHGKPQRPGNVRTRVLAKAVERATPGSAEAGEPPLPRVTRRTGYAARSRPVLYALNSRTPVEVMDEMGRNDPELALQVYRPVDAPRARRQRTALRALVEGAPIGSNGSGVDLTPLVGQAATTP